MSLNIYQNKLPFYSEEISVGSTKSLRRRWGLFNSSESYSNPESLVLESLQRKASNIDYNPDFKLRDKVKARIYGGRLEYEDQQIFWTGKPPEEVQDFIDEIERNLQRS